MSREPRATTRTGTLESRLSRCDNIGFQLLAHLSRTNNVAKAKIK